MPKEQKDIRTFLQQSRQADAKSVTIKKTAGVTKFKLRLSKYLYTLVVDDKNKATKIEQSFPPSLKAIVVGNKDEESEE